MEAIYRNRLPSVARDLVDEIEAYAGLSIGIALNPNLPPPGSVAPDHLGVTIEPDSATIYLRSLDAFPVDSVVHELLHIRRFWIEGVPRMTVVNQRPEFRTMLDNALEHLIIVPAQVHYGCDPCPWWDSVFAELLDKYRVATAESKAANAPIIYASLQRVVGSPELRAQWIEALHSAAVLESAERYWQELEPLLHDKRKMLRITIERLKIWPTAHIYAIDVRARSTSTIAYFDL